MNLIEVLSTPWAGSALGLIGILLAVIFYYRGKSVPSVSYQYTETNLIGHSSSAFPEQISITFSGRPISRVTATDLYIWNSGNTSLSNDLLVEADPFRFSCRNGEILSVELRAETRAVNKFTARPSARPNVSELEFDFLDPNDGARFYILHTGQTNSLNVEGTIRTIKNGLRKMENPTESGNLAAHFLNKAIFDRSTLIIVFIISLVGICYSVFSSQINPYLMSLGAPNAIFPDNSGRLAIFGVSALYFILPVGLWWASRRRYPRALDILSGGSEKAALPPIPNVGTKNLESVEPGGVARPSDRVRHSKFGHGNVIKSEGEKITVQFDSGAVKTIVSHFLEKG